MRIVLPRQPGPDARLRVGADLSDVPALERHPHPQVAGARPARVAQRRLLLRGCARVQATNWHGRLDDRDSELGVICPRSSTVLGVRIQQSDLAHARG